jgi:hypothetical protein
MRRIAMETGSTRDTLFPPTLIGRALHELILLTGRVRESAAPVLATACIAAMSQPSPTTGFMLAVAIELGGRLRRGAGKPGEGRLQHFAAAGGLSRLCRHIALGRERRL